ncbi:MAG: dehydrogenase [Cenarchaeum symbiont of Oopsacas minuta]|nr:dehydrogenase [Cenarchaeum symbiont of Oopsacas minuta]
MKIAVMGIGVAGSYLLSRLKNNHTVVGYERMEKERHDSICAWGSSKNRMTQMCDLSGIDFEKYVIHNGKFMHISCAGKKFNIALHGLCTYDKIGLIKDFVQGCTVHYGKAPAKKELVDEYDLVIDCTGFHRSYLPRIKNDFFLPTYEYKVEYKESVPYDDFFVHAFKGMSGYFWYFPLGKKIAHIGAGDYNKNHVTETNKFLNKYGGKIIKTVGRPIRLATPENCMPYSDGNIVGVGESIGTVFPLLGEGIIPSMECADILIKNIDDIREYERQVAKHFSIYGTVYDFVRKKIDGQFHPVKQIGNMLAIFRYMKRHEERFGMDIKLRHLAKVAQA